MRCTTQGGGRRRGHSELVETRAVSLPLVIVIPSAGVRSWFIAREGCEDVASPAPTDTSQFPRGPYHIEQERHSTRNKSHGRPRRLRPRCHLPPPTRREPPPPLPSAAKRGHGASSVGLQTPPPHPAKARRGRPQTAPLLGGALHLRGKCVLQKTLGGGRALSGARVGGIGFGCFEKTTLGHIIRSGVGGSGLRLQHGVCALLDLGVVVKAGSGPLDRRVRDRVRGDSIVARHLSGGAEGGRGTIARQQSAEQSQSGTRQQVYRLSCMIFNHNPTVFL